MLTPTDTPGPLVRLPQPSAADRRPMATRTSGCGADVEAGPAPVPIVILFQTSASAAQGDSIFVGADISCRFCDLDLTGFTLVGAPAGVSARTNVAFSSRTRETVTITIGVSSTTRTGTYTFAVQFSHSGLPIPNPLQLTLTVTPVLHTSSGGAGDPAR